MTTIFDHAGDRVWHAVWDQVRSTMLSKVEGRIAYRLQITVRRSLSTTFIPMDPVADRSAEILMLDLFGNRV